MSDQSVGRNPGYLPPGYELFSVEPRLMLALPAGVAAQAKDSARQRVEDFERGRREERLRRDQEREAEAQHERDQKKVGKTAAAEERTAALQNEVEPGSYRVLPKLATLVDELAKERIGHRFADEDHQKRFVGVRERLVARGPDRCFGMEPTWRASLAELDTVLPHFRAPIALIRNALALAEATSRAVRIPPMLLLGPPGIGKTYFSRRVAEALGTPFAALGFDQPSGGVTLRGLDKMWANTSHGLAFELVCLGDHANPVVLLDEIDKAGGHRGGAAEQPLAQLHGALEPETSRRMVDVSVDIEFDASMVTYIATANSAARIEASILSRFEVFDIAPPLPADSIELARAVASDVLGRLRLADRISVDHRALCVLAHMTPRLMGRALEKAAGQALVEGRTRVDEEALWRELGGAEARPRRH